MNTHDSVNTSRRYDLDWLRVIAIFLLLYYHTGMIYVEWRWHINSVETSEAIEVFMRFLNAWRMPLLFVISGAGTAFAFRKRNSLQYIGERTKRLLLPLTFGTFAVVAPQVYIERIDQYGSYFQFYPHFFDGIYPEGNFSWHHLWFIVYLFAYSLVCLPLFLALKRFKQAPVVENAYRFLSQRNIPGLLAVPILLSQLILRPYFPDHTHALIDDWAYFTYYLLFFVFGFMFCIDNRMWKRLVMDRHTNMVIALLAFSVSMIITYAPGFSVFSDIPNVYNGSRIFMAWYFVVSLLGYSQVHLNFNNRFLTYTNEGIYPFYILHQTVIVIIGYFALQWSMGIHAQFFMVSTLSLAASVWIYVLHIRPFNIMRILFGLKRLQRISKSENRENSIIMRKNSSILTALTVSLFLILVIIAASASGQTANENPGPVSETRNFTVLPIIAYAPETKYVGGAALLYTYRQMDTPDSRPTIIAPVFQYTQKKQIVTELNYESYLSNNNVFLKAVASYSKFPQKFYGTGMSVSDDDEETYTPVSKMLFLSFKNKIYSSFYLGLEYSYRNVSIDKTEEEGQLRGGAVTGSTGGVLSGLGVTFDWDTRNDIIYTTRGRLFSMSFSSRSEMLGSDFTYTSFNAHFREFHTLDNGTTFAWNTQCRVVSGTVPFDFLPSIGGENVLRGVIGNKFRDKNSLMVQGEIRKFITSKIGGALFAGTGTVSENFNDIFSEKFLFAYGAGLRYKLIPKENLNLRLDFGIGRDGGNLYITVAEAF